MTQATIDTTGESNDAQQSETLALGLAQHPYLTAAEGLEDLAAVCTIVLETCQELAPAFRAATPHSVQMGAQQAREGEPIGYVSGTALNRAASHFAMLAQQLGLVSGAVQTLAGEMLDAGVEQHMPDSGDDD